MVMVTIFRSISSKDLISAAFHFFLFRLIIIISVLRPLSALARVRRKSERIYGAS